MHFHEKYFPRNTFPRKALPRNAGKSRLRKKQVSLGYSLFLWGVLYDILESDPETVASRKNEKEDNKNS